MPFSIRPSRRFPLTYFSGFMSLIALLLLSSGSASAEWVLLIQTNQDGPNVYADPDSIRRKGELVEMWEMKDFKTVRTYLNYSYLSPLTRSEYDCAKEGFRVLSLTWFLGNMGTGEVVNSESTQSYELMPFSRGSYAEVLWTYACNMRNHSSKRESMLLGEASISNV